MHVVAVQFDIIWQDKAANHRIVERALDEADLTPGTFVLLPELGDTGFSFDLDRIVDNLSSQWAADQARSRGIWLQAGFAERGADGKGRNCAAVYDPTGHRIATYRKVHPFSYGREVEHFSGGNEAVLCRCESAIVAPMICYDLRFPELWRAAAIAGAEVFTIGASWPSARQSHWRSLLIARAIENQAYVVAVNRIGNDPHLSYVGGSIIVSPHGDILQEATEAPATLAAQLDLTALRQWREEFPALRDIRSELIGSFPTTGP